MGSLKVEGRSTTTEMENDEDHEARQTNPLRDDTGIETRSTKVGGNDLRIKLGVTDRREKVLLKSLERLEARYYHKPRRSRKTKILRLL